MRFTCRFAPSLRNGDFNFMSGLKNLKEKFAILLFILLLSSAFANISLVRASAETLPETQPRIVGYLPNWSYGEYTDIDFGALTHVNIAFCNVSGNGFSSGIPDSDVKAIVEKAHANRVKVMAALGGGGYCEPYRDLISTHDKIKSLNEKLTAFCEAYGLDGIDLDIELNSNDGIWNNYGAWVSALREICDAHNWQLSTATAQWVAGNVSAETFALFDFVNVMAYDNDSKGSKSHSSYEFAVECLNYFHGVKKVPKEKLVLGVPFYGRGYDDNGELDWNSYMSFSDLVEADWENYRNDEYMGVAYTGASTMRDKCALAKEYGGVMIWEITLDAEGEYSLLRLINDELYPKSMPSCIPPEPENSNFVFWCVLGCVGATSAAAGISVAAVTLKKRKK